MATRERRILERVGEGMKEVLASNTVTNLLDLGPEALPPKAVLSVASVIGLAMVVQALVSPSSTTRGARRARRRPIRRRLPTSYPDLGPGNPEWYENPDYEYVDQEDIEAVRGWFANNRKTSETSSGVTPAVDIHFDPLDYDNYEYEEVGILDFKKSPNPKKKPAKLSKRQHLGGRGKVHIARRRRPYGLVRRVPQAFPYHQLKPRVGTSPFLEGLGSRFDFGTMVSIAGLWYVWNAYLSGFVPTTILQDIANNVGNFGRSTEHDDQIRQIVRGILEMQEKTGEHNKDDDE